MSPLSVCWSYKFLVLDVHKCHHCLSAGLMDWHFFIVTGSMKYLMASDLRLWVSSNFVH